MLMEAVQKEIKEKKMKSLMVEKMQVEGVLGEKRTFLILGGRSRKHLKVAYNIQELPVLPYGHPLSKLYLQEGHPKDHGGWDSMVIRSPAKVWIWKASTTAKMISDHCLTCKYLAKGCGK
jgi:hypothetical protein